MRNLVIVIMRLLLNFFLISLIFALHLRVHIDTPCYAGVYLSKQDFLKNKISHRIDPQAEGYKFSFAFPADMKLTIRLAKPDTTLEFKPGSVFGYVECGKKYRYYPGGDLLAHEDYYGVEESRGLVIYSSKFISGNELFYSKDLSSPIRRLQLKNIEEDFAAHPAFVEAVRELNNSGLHGDLGKRDEKDRFILNNLYAQKM